MSEPTGDKAAPKPGKPGAKPVVAPVRPVAAAPIMKVRPAAKGTPRIDAPLPTPAVVDPQSIDLVAAPVAADAPAAPAAEPTPAPAQAAAEVPAVPEPAAAPVPEPAVIVSAESEPVASSKPFPAAAPVPTPAIKRGIFDMATPFDAAVSPAAAAQKVQAMFGGVNDRTKTAMEKGAKFSEELIELTKGNVEAIVASGKIAAKGAESLTQEAVEYGKKNFETATSMFKSLAAVKSPTELFQLQSDFAKSSFDGVVAEASKMSEAFVKLAGEVVQPISNRYAVAADKLKPTAL